MKDFEKVKLISKKNFLFNEFQFLIPIVICLLFFFLINISNIYRIDNFSYFPHKFFSEPLRLITFNFIHKDINHLISNLFGIVIIRYSLIKLKLKNGRLFLYLIGYIIPTQSFLLYVLDKFILYHRNYSLIGFSGIIFATYSFLMLSAFYGNKFFFKSFVGLKKNSEIYKILFFLLVIGMIFSLLPEVSFMGHLSGMMSGIMIYLISKK